ncbi:DUF2635 domain-containing protein [Citrobacter farmeri]|uniref:DUF2635 domain-containing protein n=1 Tax=Citrobacter farmeri TaxID=67824 RepID=UPI001923F296|nr:DUF2635 domain-containing protein [Citrobacter farmeri]MBJ8744031.1 DUF2635 domain-containing protein [Citrobacter farmeri]MBJ8758154.1 DUF2635 domain-containing protein [Citrobacter farmeri]
MSDTLKLKPVAGRTVRDPKTMKVLAADGEEKPRTSYWTRRLADGDVALVEDTTGSDARTATDANNSDKSTADESPTPAKKGAK